MSKACITIFILASIVRIAIGEESTVIFEKPFDDGSIVIVEKRMREEHIVPDDDQLVVEKKIEFPGRVFGGDLLVYDVAMQIKEEQGEKEIVWQKELRSLIIPGREVPIDFVVRDVEKKENKLAIVYSHGYATYLEIMRKNEQDIYQITIQQLLYRGEALFRVYATGMVWHDELFVLVGFEPYGTDIWRVDTENKVVERIFTQRRIWQAEE